MAVDLGAVESEPAGEGDKVYNVSWTGLNPYLSANAYSMRSVLG